MTSSLKVENKKVIAQGLKPRASAVWSIDSVQVNPVKIKKFRSVLSALGFGDEEVLTTSIFSPFDLGWLIPIDKKLKQKSLGGITTKVKEQWSKFSIPFNESGVLISESNSNREEVMTLIHYAKKHKGKNHSRRLWRLFKIKFDLNWEFYRSTYYNVSNSCVANE